MPCSARASSMPRPTPSRCSVVAQADLRGVVGRDDQLDVDSALGGAARQVLEGEVAVVLAGADHARGEVVGAQEVEEVGVGVGLLVGEQALRDRQAVALGEPADELRRGRALEVDVQLGLRDHQRSSSITGCGGGPGGSPSV